MIVTSSATQRLPKENTADGINLLVGNVHALLFAIDAQQYLWTYY